MSAPLPQKASKTKRKTKNTSKPNDESRNTVQGTKQTNYETPSRKTRHRAEDVNEDDEKTTRLRKSARRLAKSYRTVFNKTMSDTGDAPSADIDELDSLGDQSGITAIYPYPSEHEAKEQEASNSASLQNLAHQSQAAPETFSSSAISSSSKPFGTVEMTKEAEHAVIHSAIVTLLSKGTSLDDPIVVSLMRALQPKATAADPFTPSHVLPSKSNNKTTSSSSVVAKNTRDDKASSSDATQGVSVPPKVLDLSGINKNLKAAPKAAFVVPTKLQDDDDLEMFKMKALPAMGGKKNAESQALYVMDMMHLRPYDDSIHPGMIVFGGKTFEIRNLLKDAGCHFDTKFKTWARHDFTAREYVDLIETIRTMKPKLAIKDRRTEKIEEK